jgi:hypothetical protein
MNKLIALLLFLLSACAGTAQADTSYDFVRIACVPENGLLAVEYRMLHDAVSGDKRSEKRGVPTALSRAGFYRPDGLRFACNLGGVRYLITATQGRQTEWHCGAAPNIVMNVTRNGVSMLKDVIFGAVCLDYNSVTRFTIGDGPMMQGNRETEVCYGTGGDFDVKSAQCEWSFMVEDFDKNFPVDQARVDAMAERYKVH